MKNEGQDSLICLEWSIRFLRKREAKQQEDGYLSMFCDKVARENPTDPKDSRYICELRRQIPCAGYQPALRAFSSVSQM